MGDAGERRASAATLATSYRVSSSVATAWRAVFRRRPSRSISRSRSTSSRTSALDVVRRPRACLSTQATSSSGRLTITFATRPAWASTAAPWPIACPRGRLPYAPPGWPSPRAA